MLTIDVSKEKRDFLSDFIKKDYDENFNSVSKNERRCNIAIIENYYTNVTSSIPIRYKGITYSLQRSKKGTIFLHRNFDSRLAVIKMSVVRNRILCEMTFSENIKTVDFEKSVAVTCSSEKPLSFSFYLNNRFFNSLTDEKLYCEDDRGKKLCVSLSNVYFDTSLVPGSYFYILEKELGDLKEDIVFKEITNNIFRTVLPLKHSSAYDLFSDCSEKNFSVKVYRVNIKEGLFLPAIKKTIMNVKKINNSIRVFPTQDMNSLDIEAVYRVIVFHDSKEYSTLRKGLEVLSFRETDKKNGSLAELSEVYNTIATSCLKNIQSIVKNNTKDVLFSAIRKEIYMPKNINLKDITNLLKTLDAEPRLHHSDGKVRFFFSSRDSFKNDFLNAIYGCELPSFPSKYDVKDESFVLDLPYKGTSIKYKRMVADSIVNIVKEKLGYTLKFYIEK